MTMTLFSTPDRTTVREFVLLRDVLIITVTARSSAREEVPR